jgi:hypothetical protein
MVGVILLLRLVVINAEEAFSFEKIPGLMRKRLEGYPPFQTYHIPSPVTQFNA